MGWPIKIEPWLAFLGGGVSYSPPYYQEIIIVLFPVNLYYSYRIIVIDDESFAQTLKRF